jgi:hypothetical protein
VEKPPPLPRRSAWDLQETLDLAATGPPLPLPPPLPPRCLRAQPGKAWPTLAAVRPSRPLAREGGCSCFCFSGDTTGSGEGLRLRCPQAAHAVGSEGRKPPLQ